MKRKREITFETERIVIRGDLRKLAWCEACAASTAMVTVDQASALIGNEAEQLYSKAGQGQVHSTRTPGGVVMICLKSLSALPGSKGQTKLERAKT